MSMHLLSGLRAVEIGTSVKAGFLGKLLHDAGAEVIKVGLPETATPRHPSPWLDRGKASVVMDWRLDEGLALLGRLLGRVDVLVSDIPSAVEAASLKRIASERSQLVYVSLRDLGHEGPFADRPSSDLIVSALSGMCYINGEAGHTPLREPGNQTAIIAALAGYLGALAAITARSRVGKGQAVEVSALEAMVNVLSPSVLQNSYQNGGPTRRAKADGFLFDCADGQVSIIISAERSWQTIVEMWDLTIDPAEAHRFTEAERRLNLPAIRELLAPVLARKTRREVFEELSLVRVPAGMLLNPGELQHDAHLVARASFERLAARSTGGQAGPFPGAGFRVSGEYPNAEYALANLGEDTARLLAPLAADGARR